MHQTFFSHSSLLLYLVCVCVCVCHPSLQLRETSCVCVYSTWFTCSRRAGCQQQLRHFTSALSGPHHGQEDHTSTSEHAGTGCTARSDPVVHVDSTCARRASCQQEDRHTASLLIDGEQAEKTVSLLGEFLVLTTIYNSLKIQLCLCVY